MRPLSIAVHNWLSYGAAEKLPNGLFKPTINFEAFELACITGANGHGKSAAAVDALRYALFGKARHSGSQELGQVDLKRKGAEEAAVQLRFEVQGQVYTVTRWIGRRGQSTAELVHSDGSVVSGVREVEGQLKGILGGLDDIAFMASCVVGQGDATQFMQRSPGERKDILYNVLGLGALTDRSDAAKRRATEFAKEALSAEAQISLLRTQTEKLDEKKSERPDKQVEMDGVAKQLAELTAVKGAAETRKGELMEAKAKSTVLISEANQHRPKLREFRSQRQQYSLGAPERDLKRRTSEIQAAYDQYMEAWKSEQVLADAKVKVGRLLSRISELTVLIGGARQALIQERNSLRGLGIDCAGAENSLQEAQADVGRLEQELAELQGLCEQIEHNANNINFNRHQLKQSLGNANREQQMLKQRLSNLEDQLRLGQAACPLCGQDLTDKHAGTVQKDLQTDLARADGNFASLEEQLIALPLADQLAREVEGAKQKAQKHSAGLELARRIVLSATQDRDTAKKNTQRLAMLDEVISSNSYSVIEQGELRELTDQVRAIYDETAHTAAVSRRQGFQSAEGPYRELMTVLDKDANRKRITESIRGLHRTLRRVRTELNRIGFLEDELVDAKASVQRLDEQGKTLVRRRGELDRELAALDTDILWMEGLDGTLQETFRRHTEYMTQHNLWTQLADAYGEKGVQAFLTRRAIAGLQKETNERLRDWTDGQLSAEMSYEDTRGLLVILKDSLGEERKFHACSGGEQFRVALSIRIALSRLMANRIGVKPRILIIDEGFGTQDEEGIDGLERTLKSLVGAFSNIIVITHIEAMQKRFDYHITVSKTSSGSQLCQPGL